MYSYSIKFFSLSDGNILNCSIHSSAILCIHDILEFSNSIYMYVFYPILSEIFKTLSPKTILIWYKLNPFSQSCFKFLSPWHRVGDICCSFARSILITSRFHYESHYLRVPYAEIMNSYTKAKKVFPIRYMWLFLAG